MNSLFLNAVVTAVEAGAEILTVYSSEIDVQYKEDDSPLTLADRKSHDLISKKLQATTLPVLSEEGKKIAYAERNKWTKFWLVDPLDGTKEFIKRNGEFTVNIAYIENNSPRFGVIYQPAKDIAYWGGVGLGAWKLNQALQHLNNLVSHADKLPTQTLPDVRTVVASRSHLSEETLAFVENEKQLYGSVEFISSGSSLKFCLLADGLAHVYPRLAPTMEWDVAAGHAILKGVGKDVYAFSTGNELTYNKENLVNEWFIAR